MQPEVYAEMARLQTHHWWFAARRQVLAGLIARLELPDSAQILDIGCGTGGNLAMLRQFGHLHAVEAHADARRQAAALGICPVADGMLPDPLPFEDRGFDLVCLLDVIEHVADDTAAIQRSARLLKPGGRLLVTVPAYAWLWSAHDTAHHHYRRYTGGMLTQLAAAAELRMDRLGYFNSLLFPGIALARLTRKLVGHSRGSDATLPRPAINAWLTRTFALERHIVPYRLFPWGTSALALMTRST